jgi:hypothetical protein
MREKAKQLARALFPDKQVLVWSVDESECSFTYGALDALIDAIIDAAKEEMGDVEDPSSISTARLKKQEGG